MRSPFESCSSWPCYWLPGCVYPCVCKKNFTFVELSRGSLMKINECACCNRCMQNTHTYRNAYKYILFGIFHCRYSTFFELENMVCSGTGSDSGCVAQDRKLICIITARNFFPQTSSVCECVCVA